jgi:hypothetical protein
MISSKPVLSSSDQSDLHLPTISKVSQRRFRSSPTPSHTSNTSATTNTSESISALKAKYSDYAMWLRSSSKRNREPLFTHELLKHSLCEMGIDSTHAEQLVSTCTWYVYQFHKELEGDAEQQKATFTTETSNKITAPEAKHWKRRKTKVRTSDVHRRATSESTVISDSVSKGSFHLHLLFLLTQQ